MQQRWPQWSCAFLVLWAHSASADEPKPFAEALPDSFEQNEQDPAIGDSVEQGTFTLPSPIKLESARMPVLVDVFPKYSPRNGTSAWGRGWESPFLSIRRERMEGVAQFNAGDHFTSGWGTLLPVGSALYVRGFLQPVEGQLTGAAIVILDAVGTKWTYDGTRYNTPRGPERWELVSVADVFGDRVALSYGTDGNLERATWTRQGLRAHQVDISYTKAETVAASEFIAGTNRASQRRVDKVVISNTHREHGTLVPVVTYALRFEAPKREWLVTSVVETRQGESRTTTCKYGTPWIATRDGLGGKVVASAASLPTYPTIPAPQHAFASDSLAAMDVSDDGGSDVMTKDGSWWIYHRDKQQYVRSTYLDNPQPGCIDKDAPWPSLLRLRHGFEPSFLARLVSKAKNTLELTQCSLQGKVVSRARLAVPQLPPVVGCEAIKPGPIVRNGEWLHSMADLNADGVPDLSVADACRLLVWYGKRDGDKIVLSNSVDVIEAAGLDPSIANVAMDFNGDGLVDLIDYSRDQRVWLNRGNVRSQKPAFAAPVSLHHEQTEGSSIGTCERFLLHLDTDRMLDSMIACQLTDPVGGAPGWANFRFSFFRGELERFRQVKYLDEPRWFAGWPSTLAVSEFAGLGLTFVELQPAPRASAAAGCPAGSARGTVQGQHGPEYWCSPLAYWMSLAGPDADVMTSVENGRGERTSFSYAWSTFPERFGRGPVVLARKTREMVGRDPLISEYRYEDPWFEGRVHAFGGFLKITRTEQRGAVSGSEKSTSVFTFEVYDGIAKRQQTSITGSDGSIRSRAWKYEIKQRAGLSLVRQLSEVTSLSIAGVSSERARTDFVYASPTDMCPQKRTWTLLVGSKTSSETTLTYTKPSQAPSLVCMEASRVVVGSYADSSLGFTETQRQSYSMKGQLIKVEAVADGRAITLQKTSYAVDGNPTETSTGTATTKFTAYRPLVFNKKRAPTTLIQSMVLPDGRTLELDYDPVTDQPTTLRAMRDAKDVHVERRLTRTSDAWGRLRSEAVDYGTGMPTSWRTIEYRDAAPPQLGAEFAVNRVTGERRMTVRDGAGQTMAELVAVSAAGTQTVWQIESARLDNDTRNETMSLVGGTVKLAPNAIPTKYQLMSSGATVVKRWKRMPGSLDSEEVEGTSAGELTWKTKASLDSTKLLVLTRTDGTRTEIEKFNGANRLVLSVDASGIQRTAQYDANGRMRRLLFPKFTAFATYDSFGRVVASTNSDLYVSYKYMPDSLQIECETTRKGTQTLESCFTYNAIGQVITRTSSTNKVIDDFTRWTYEPGFAQPTTVEGPNYKTELTSDGVDAFGQFKDTRRITVFPLPEVISPKLQHDTSRRLTYVESTDYLADGSAFRTSTVLELEGTKVPGGTTSCAREVNAFGDTARWLCGGTKIERTSDSSKTTFSFANGRTVTVSHSDGLKRWDRIETSQPGTTTWGTTRLIGMDGLTTYESRPGRSTGYGRFPDGALQQVDVFAQPPTRLESYEYDERGLLSSSQGQKIVRSNNQIVLGSRVWKLDDLGRFVSSDGTSITWDSRNQVTSATRAGRSARYVHDASGLRLLRADAAQWTFTFGTTQVQIPASGKGTARIRAPLVLDGHILGVLTENGARDVAHDAVNTLVMDGGKPQYLGAFGQRETHQLDVPEYVGAYYDDLLGVYRFGVRDYLPELAQFTSPDSLMLRAPSITNDRRSSNLYSYARANPQDFADPTGFEECQTTSEGCRGGSGSLEDICSEFGGCAPPIDVDGRSLEEMCADFGGCAPPIEGDYRTEGESTDRSSLGIGINATVAFGVAVSVEAGMVQAGHGMGLYLTGGLGGGTPGASLVPVVSGSSADNLSQLSGAGWSTAIARGLPVGVGAFGGAGYSGFTFSVLGVSLFPVGNSGMMTYTLILPISTDRTHMRGGGL